MATIETTPMLARERQMAGALLVDVREPEEHALGVPGEALRVPRAALEARPDAVIPDHDSEVLLICASGQRSLRATEALRAQGYRNVQSVAGGCQAWLAEGLPIEARRDADFMERYSRHLRLPQVGLEGQEKLERARVLLVGAGGLGSPAAFYLAAAGVGYLRLVDDDVVDRSNLQRQILHTEQRIGEPKVASATLALSALNPRVRIEPVQARVTSANVDALVADVDLVIDGADNFATRYLLSDACVQHRKPLVYGAVHRFDGQASVFDAGRRRGESPCYRCLFPEPPDAADAPNCAEAGVLGVLPGIIGLIQANEAIKLVLGLGDALGMRFHESRLTADPACPVCAPGVAFPGYSVPGDEACRA
jgi:molybdopterin/thiamine biosynthesis adenylyltransferase/rhodanese-related sulfurtransferase